MTKCTNNTCILSTKCLRYLKESKPFTQSYTRFEPVGNECNYFKQN